MEYWETFLTVIRLRARVATSTAKAHASANALSPGLADALLNLRGKHQDNGQLVTGLAQSDGVFLGAGQANQAVRNMQEEDEIYSGPTGLTVRGRNIHSLRKDLQTGCEPDAEQRGISTVLSRPARAGGSAGDPIPLPLMLTGQHEDMEQTMTPDVTADDGDGIARQLQPAEGGRADYIRTYNDRRREKRAAQRELEDAAAAMTGQCAGRRGCKCNECDGRRREKRKADVRLSMQHARAKKAAAGLGSQHSYQYNVYPTQQAAGRH